MSKMSNEHVKQNEIHNPGQQARYEYFKLRGMREVFTFSPRGDVVLVTRQGRSGKVAAINLSRNEARKLWADLKEMGFRQADSKATGGSCA